MSEQPVTSGWYRELLRYFLVTSDGVPKADSHLYYYYSYDHDRRPCQCYHRGSSDRKKVARFCHDAVLLRQFADKLVTRLEVQVMYVSRMEGSKVKGFTCLHFSDRY